MRPSLVAGVVVIAVAACSDRAPPEALVVPAPASGTLPAPVISTDEPRADTGDWRACAETWHAIAAWAGRDERLRAYREAAVCYARGGELDDAFDVLDALAAIGARRLDDLLRDDDLAALRDDPRWPRLLAAIEANHAAWEATLVDPALRRELLALAAAPSDPDDRRIAHRIKQVIAKHGWPGKRVVGEDGAHAAWLLVQHSSDRALQAACLPLLEQQLALGEVSASDYAFLYDRVATSERRKQRYGTQFDNFIEPAPIEDEVNLDARRTAIGLPPMAEYRRQQRR